MLNSRAVNNGVRILLLVAAGLILAPGRLSLRGSYVAAAPGGFPQASVRTTGTVTTTTIFTTPTTVTDAALPVAANSRYLFEFFVRYQSDLATVGIALFVAVPADSTLEVIAAIPDQNPGNGGLHWQHTSNVGLSASPTTDAVDTSFLARVYGLVETGANAGTIQLKFGSETGGTETRVMPGTVGLLTKLP